MLDFLVQSGDISKPDGLLATWFHRANSKEEMNKALTSKLSHTDFFNGVVCSSDLHTIQLLHYPPVI